MFKNKIKTIPVYYLIDEILCCLNTTDNLVYNHDLIASLYNNVLNNKEEACTVYMKPISYFNMVLD